MSKFKQGDRVLDWTPRIDNPGALCEIMHVKSHPDDRMPEGFKNSDLEAAKCDYVIQRVDNEHFRSMAKGSHLEAASSNHSLGGVL